jgi:hypothetical protein
VKVGVNSEVAIHSWAEWIGPEDPLAAEIGLHQQRLYDVAVLQSEKELWDHALRFVVGVAAQIVLYVEGEDSWYAPNVAVWSVAWTFTLEEVHIARDTPVPPELGAQLYWYGHGHWPCALVHESSIGRVQDYVVY